MRSIMPHLAALVLMLGAATSIRAQQSTQPASNPSHQTVLKVIGPDGQPIDGAVLYIYDANRSTPGWRTPKVTNENGEYRWEHAAFANTVQVSVGIHQQD